MTVPEPLRSARAWLVWRLVQRPGHQKPSKVPFYASGQARSAQGTKADRAALVSFDEARAIRGYDGIGFATLSEFGVVALDFDNVVAEGVIDQRVLDAVAYTYAEISPSGNGVRAFFTGYLPSRKDTQGDPSLEVFGDTGFVTFTGNVIPGHDLWGVSPVTPVVLALYEQRFGRPDAAGSTMGHDLMAVVPTLGWRLDEARAILADCDAGTDRDHWLKTLAALHHEFDGSDAALALADEWSARGANYSGRADVEGRWRSFGRKAVNPITGRWLLKWQSECRSKAYLNTQRETLALAVELISSATDSLQLKADIAGKLRKILPYDSVVFTEVRNVFRDRYKVLSDGATLTAAEVVELIAPAKAAPISTVKSLRPLTAFGNAERMLDRFGSLLMYVPETAAWHYWTGVYWRIALDVELERLAKETIKALPDEAGDHHDQSQFFQHCEVSQRKRMIDDMIAIARSDPRVVVSVRDLDADADLIGVRNGVIRISSAELLPPDAAYRITQNCNVPYQADARAPLWEQTVLEAFDGDVSLAEFFQRVIGYAACGQPDEDVMVILFGNGANGKSTILGVIRRALGSYARAADASSFVTDGKNGVSAGGAREDLMRLMWARFVYINEPDEGGEVREGMVKSMTGGDAITARGLYSKSSVEILPTWLICMATNHLPIIKGNDNGIWRRLLCIPFERNFESDPTIVKDPKREEKLLAELPGVLAWILRGATLYKQMGLAPPDSVKRARDTYRSNMDLLSEWLEESCDIGPGLASESSTLWQSWSAFASARGLSQYVRSSVALGRKLGMVFKTGAAKLGERMNLAT